jgi:hypothetical protein
MLENLRDHVAMTLADPTVVEELKSRAISEPAKRSEAPAKPPCRLGARRFDFLTEAAPPCRAQAAERHSQHAHLR